MFPILSDILFDGLRIEIGDRGILSDLSNPDKADRDIIKIVITDQEKKPLMYGAVAIQSLEETGDEMIIETLREMLSSLHKQRMS